MQRYWIIELMVVSRAGLLMVLLAGEVARLLEIKSITRPVGAAESGDAVCAREHRAARALAGHALMPSIYSRGPGLARLAAPAGRRPRGAAPPHG